VRAAETADRDWNGFLEEVLLEIREIVSDHKVLRGLDGVKFLESGNERLRAIPAVNHFVCNLEKKFNIQTNFH